METGLSLNVTRDDLQDISLQILQIHNRLCNGNEETISDFLLDIVIATLVTETVDDPGYLKALERKRDSLKTLLTDGGIEIKTGFVVPVQDNQLLDVIHQQLRFLKKAINIKESCLHNLSTGNQNGSSLDEEDLMPTLSLESLLSIRDEQISTLRDIIRANKQSAEDDLANLKSKYEKEKSIVSETMLKLRSELNDLKQGKESFVGLRSLFATRCDQFITQLKELQTHLTSSEEDLKQLNVLMGEMASARSGSLADEDE